jgi:ferric-dicitrate binding protein FerR (iron transport regulator)
MWLRVAAALLPLFILAGSYFLLKNALEERDVAVNISVPYGENREVKLSDGSVVFLNAGSNLQYTVASGKTVRDVILNGEAYFSIAKDASRPFTVRTEHLSIEVPGTEFNVKAYPDETKTTATLNSGRIKAETDGGQAYVLNPGGQLSYSSRSKSATLSHVDATDFSAWKDGRLIFNDTPLHEIIAAIERKFDVRFAPDSSIDLDDRYSVKFIHGEDLPRIMKIMETVCGFNCHTEGKTILLTKTETKT